MNPLSLSQDVGRATQVDCECNVVVQRIGGELLDSVRDRAVANDFPGRSSRTQRDLWRRSSIEMSPMLRSNEASSRRRAGFACGQSRETQGGDVLPAKPLSILFDFVMYPNDCLIIGVHNG